MREHFQRIQRLGGNHELRWIWSKGAPAQAPAAQLETIAAMIDIVRSYGDTAIADFPTIERGGGTDPTAIAGSRPRAWVRSLSGTRDVAHGSA